jgi:hypothetical protein
MNDAAEHLMTIFSGALDCGTEEEREAYLDRACADHPGLRQRAEALIRAHARTGHFLGGPPIGRTVSAGSTPASGPGPRSSSGRVFDEELRRLLRSRLILVHLLFLGWTVLLSVLHSATPRSEQDPVFRPDTNMWWEPAAPLAEGLIGTLVLWRSRGLSVGSLRRWEWICFATQAAYNGLSRFIDLARVGLV